MKLFKCAKQTITIKAFNLNNTCIWYNNNNNNNYKIKIKTKKKSQNKKKNSNDCLSFFKHCIVNSVRSNTLKQKNIHTFLQNFILI